MTTSYAYDGVERLSGLTQNFAGTASDQTYGLTYNPANQVNTQSSSNAAFSWTGWAAGAKTYAPDGLNRYGAVGGVGFTYDANGNLTSDGSTTYVYDVENRLVSSTGAHPSTMTYDPNGRLWGLNGGTTQFLYDGDNLVAEYNNAGTLLRRYVHGPGPDEPMLWYEGSGLTDRRFYHANHQGSIAAVSNAAGAPSIVNTYNEYGVQGASNSGRFQYTGQTYIAEPALYYYKARFYSPTLGRFMQTDPVGYEDDVNLYAYVGNDPLTKTDPSGEAGCGPNDPIKDCDSGQLPPSVTPPTSPPPDAPTVTPLVITAPVRVTVTVNGAPVGRPVDIPLIFPNPAWVVNPTGQALDAMSALLNQGHDETTKGKKGTSLRGGKKSQRDKWYGKEDQDFHRWWHRKGKREFGGGDIDSPTEAQEAWDHWVDTGRPQVK